MSSRKATAYHEAGHAVVALALRIPVMVATIIPDHGERSAGAVTLGHGWTASLEWDNGPKISAHAAQSAAGVIAATILRFDRIARIDELREQETDFGMVCDAAVSNLCPGPDGVIEARPYLRRQMRRAERILRKRWRAVEAVAVALMKQKTLTGRELRAILERTKA